MMLKCNYKHISLAKIGNSKDENEDNILAPSTTEIIDEQIVRFAISDGATESSFSKEWSDLLVSCFKDKSFDPENLPTTIKRISETWQSMAKSIELPWYAEQKAENGAFATFLGITLNFTNAKFEAVAIGDCTLFLIRNDKLDTSFPITKIEEYGNTPNLFSSNQKYQTDFEKTVNYLDGIILKDDLLILASDALAMWIFQRIKEGEKPWYSLMTLLNYEEYQTDFANWTANKIKENEIKNDDISLVIINIE